MSSSEFPHSGDFEDAVPGRGGGAEDAAGERLDAPFAIDLAALEEQQRRVLALLERAEGAAVSFAELRDAGIEFPASVVSELELVGIPIQRCSEGGGTERRAAGVRLTPSRELGSAFERSVAPAWGAAVVAPNGSPAAAGAPPAAPATASAGEPEHLPRPGGRARRPIGLYPRRPRIVLIGGLVAAAAAVPIAIALAGGSAHPRPARSLAGTHTTPSRASAPAATIRPSRPIGSAPPKSRRPTRSAPPKREHVIAKVKPAPRTAPASGPAPPVSLALAVQLDAQGHTLLESGSYASAVMVLRRSIATSGESLAACLQPLTVACLTYAYALYDLGRALRLGGNPQAAVAVLEARLEIDNQRPVVAAELNMAQAEARRATTPAAH